MELNFIISIVNRNGCEDMVSLCLKHGFPIILTALGRGTATKKLLNLYGLEATEKSVVLTTATAQKTKDFILDVREKFYIDIPGNGIVLSVPVKSVGGAKTLAFLSDHATPDKLPPQTAFENEVIVVISNEGYAEPVMDAARAAGARGGTVIHAKGNGPQKAEFYNVSLAAEKEIILIVSKSSEKSDIMHNIIKEMGPDSPAGSVVFSMPVSHLAGLRLGPGTP